MSTEKERYWSRYKEEESLRIFESHLKRRCNITAQVSTTSQKKYADSRERYLTHRKNAQAVEAKRISEEIKEANMQLGTRIQNIEQGGGRRKRIQPDLPTEPCREQRPENELGHEMLLLNNLRFVKRIVSAKPFCSRSDWRKHEQDMKDYTKRLERTRKSRQQISAKRPQVWRSHATGVFQRHRRIQKSQAQQPIEKKHTSSGSQGKTKFEEQLEQLELEFEKLLKKKSIKPHMKPKPKQPPVPKCAYRKSPRNQQTIQTTPVKPVIKPRKFKLRKSAENTKMKQASLSNFIASFVSATISAALMNQY